MMRIEIPKDRSTLGAVPTCASIAPDLRHGREVDDYPAVFAAGNVFIVVPATSLGDSQVVIACLLHRLDNLLGMI